MGTRERRDREKQDVRARIIDAAREMFDAEGYAAVSMRRLAEKIEYSPTAIYAYFKDKDDLLRQICADDFKRFHAGQSEVGSIADPVERIREMGLAYVRFAVEHPNHFKRMFLDPPNIPMNEEAIRKKGDPSQDGYAFFRMAVAEAATDGRFAKNLSHDVDLLTQTLWAAVHGVAALCVSQDGPDSWVTLRPTELLAGTIVDRILCGLAVELPVSRSTRRTPTKVRR